MMTFSKPSFTHFFQRMAPRRGGFTRFHQTWHQLPAYTFTPKGPKEQIFGLQRHVSWIRGPHNRWGPHKNIFKTLIYPFFTKKLAPGGGVTRFHQTWH